MPTGKRKGAFRTITSSFAGSGRVGWCCFATGVRRPGEVGGFEGVLERPDGAPVEVEGVAFACRERRDVEVSPGDLGEGFFHRGPPSVERVGSQYSSGSSKQVEERSASVMTHSLSPRTVV